MSSFLDDDIFSCRVSVEDPSAERPVCGYLVEAEIYGPDVKKTYNQALKGTKAGGKWCSKQAEYSVARLFSSLVDFSGLFDGGESSLALLFVLLYPLTSQPGP